MWRRGRGLQEAVSSGEQRALRWCNEATVCCQLPRVRVRHWDQLCGVKRSMWLGVTWVS